MKILLVEGESTSDGQARHVCDLALGLHNRGHAAVVACRQPGLYKALAAAEIPVIRMEFQHVLDVSTILRLVRMIRQECFDVVHTHGVHAGVTGRIAAHLAHCPRIVHTVHCIPSSATKKQGPMSVITRTACKLLDRWLASLTHTIVASSHDLHRMMLIQGIVESKVVTIHPGIDPSPYRVSADAHQARNKLCIPNGCRVVGVITHLARHKNLGDFISAASIANRQMDMLFVIVGEGEEEDRLKRLAKDMGAAHTVLFSNYHGDAASILPAFDVFALSSLWEDPPLTVLQAMAAGLPVVAPDISGIRETVVDGVTGCIVPIADPQSLADRICSVFQEGSADRMGAAGRQRVMELFSLDRMIELVEKVYLSSGERQSSRVPAEARS